MLVLLALPLAACGRQGGEQAPGSAASQKEPIAVTVAEVTRGRLDETVELVGRVRGHVEVAVRPLVAGVVDEVRVQVGDRVQEGQVLVILDAEQAEAQVEQAQAAVEAARAGLHQAEWAARSQRLQADAELEQARLAEKAARAQLDGAREALAALEEQWKALGCGRQGAAGGRQSPAASGAAAGAGTVLPGQTGPGGPSSGSGCAGLAGQISQARAGVRQAELNLEGARTRLKAAQEAHELARSGDPLAAPRAQVRQAEAALAAARRQLDQARVTAPVAGVVAAVYARAGEPASPQAPQPLVVLVDPDPARVEADLPEGLYQAVKPGTSVDVTVAGKTYRGRVMAKTLVPDARTGSYTLTVEIPDSGGELVPGQAARVKVPVQQGEERLLIPAEALQEGDEPGTGEVFVYEQGRAVRRAVRYERMTSDRVAVLDGLREGERVIVRGRDLVADGDPVRVVAE